MHPSLPDPTHQGLLVLTEPRRHSLDLLRLRYRETAVVELLESADDIDINGRFSSVFVDRSSLDLPWLARLTRTVVRSLPPAGRVIVALDPAGELVSPPGAVKLEGLEWVGLEIINGRTCAVLRAVDPGADSPGETATLLATAHTAVRLATTVAAEDGTRVAVEDARRLLAQQVDGQFRSERALLDQLERLADQLRHQEPPPPTLRAVIRRSKLGPPVRLVLRLARRTAGQLRRVGTAREGR